MQTLSYDLHIHSCLSPCGEDDMTPANIAGMAKVIGLDVIALTDHNSCKNCPAILRAAQEYGITVLCGMELCTAEEVHVLCYFPTLDNAMDFDSYVYGCIPDLPNTPALFGNQLLYNEEDQMCGSEEKLLISATTISFDRVYDLVHQYHGIMIPAHIDKTANGLLSNLGFIPPDSRFSCVEVKDITKWDSLRQQYSYLQNCLVLTSSDAHDFNSMHEPLYHLHPEENSPSSILKWIEGKA